MNSAISLNSIYTYEQLFPLLYVTLKAKVSSLILGPPGIGKSALAQELAEKMGLPLIDIRLAQKDPAELGGVYFPDKETHTLELFAPEWVKKACNEPCLIFLDEFNSAVTKLHQAAAYQIVLERRIGKFQFHPDTLILAAGNREEDNSIVTTLSSALCNRFAHFEMGVDAECFLKWAANNNINSKIMAFIRTYGKDVLFAPSDDMAFATPRSWAMASRIIDALPQEDWKKAVASCVGVAMAERFEQYLKIYGMVHPEKIVSGEQIIDFRKKRDPSFIYAAMFAVADYLTKNEVKSENYDHIMNFLLSPGAAPEFQLLFLRQIRNRKAELFDRLKSRADFLLLANELVSLRATIYLKK